MAKIFISSTYQDLAGHREAVDKILRRMKQESVIMEFFGSRTDEPTTVCEKEILDSDIVVGIYAHRYGWIPDHSKISITEMEFDWALKHGKRILCYTVQEKGHPWLPEWMDEGEIKKRLQSFKSNKAGKFIKSNFTTPENLAAQVAADLSRTIGEIEQTSVPQYADFYIEPELERFNTLEALNNYHSQPYYSQAFDKSAEGINFPKLIKAPIKAFIIADPGYGKSELLCQIVKAIEERGKKAKFIELRKLKNPVAILNQFQEGCSIYCFDALDEVSHGHYYGIIHQLKEFSIRHPDMTILISCRRHDAMNNYSAFGGFDGFQFIRVAPFSFERIKAYVEGAGIKDDQLARVLFERAMPHRERSSILSVPRYLRTVIDLLISGRVTEIELRTWKRIDFFERFIYSQFEAEEEKRQEWKRNDKEIMRRVLEKIALIMEIHQTNAITKEEFITFLDEADSNLNLVFLNVCDIDTFLERILQPKKEKTGDYLEFHNTEFQEYLAAKELNRLASSPQVVYDFVVQPEFRQIYPNWYEVLRYLVEINPDHLPPLVEFLQSKKENWIENAFWGLLAGIDTEELAPEGRAKVFESVYKYIQNTPGAYVPRVSVDLSKFFVPSVTRLIIEPPEELDNEDQKRRLFNQLEILQALVDKITGPERERWRSFLFELAEQSDDPVLKNAAVFHLAYFGKSEDLQRLKPLFDSGEEQFRKNYIYACSMISPENEFTLGIFIDGLRDTEKHSAIDGINNLTDPGLLKSLIEQFITGQNLLLEYLRGSDNYISANPYGFIDNIEKVWDEKFPELLMNLLKIAWSRDFPFYHHTEKLDNKMIILLGKKRPDLIPELLDVHPHLFSFLHNHMHAIHQVLTPENTKEFITKATSVENSPHWLISDIFRRLYQEDAEEQSEVYEIARNFFPDEFNRWENPPDPELLRREQEEREKENIHIRFKELLEPEPGLINLGVFNHYLENREVIEAEAQEEDLNRLRNWLKERIPKIDPLKTRIGITRTDDRNSSISMNMDVGYFLVYLRAAEAMGILSGIDIPREHLLGFIPLLSDNSYQGLNAEKIIEMIGDLSANDQEYLLSTLTQRADDYLRFSATGFASVVQKLGAEKLVPLLHKMVVDEGLRPYERIQVCKILADSFPNQEYMEEIFETYQSADGELVNLAKLANECLIRVFRISSAKKWRYEKIKELEQFFDEPDRKSSKHLLRPYTEWESEMDKLHFARPLIDIQDSTLASKIKELLRYGLQLLEKDKRYKKYSEYTQRIAYEYYDALKEKEGLAFLRGLFTFLDSQCRSTKHLFNQFRTQLQANYINIHEKPQNIHSSINKYNNVKSRSYLPIYDARDLNFIILQVIEEDIRRFVYQEGFYRVIQKYFINGEQRKEGQSKPIASIREDYIQKTLKIQLENALIRKGIRDVDIIREPQLYDDKRIDLLIKYGFVPPVVVELKLLHNPEIKKPKKRIAYKEKLKHYMESQNAAFGIYLVFKVRKEKQGEYFEALRLEYQDIEGLAIPDLIDCTVNFA